MLLRSCFYRHSFALVDVSSVRPLALQWRFVSSKAIAKETAGDLNNVDDVALRKKDTEGTISATQSGLFKLLLPLPATKPASRARYKNEEIKDHVLFLLHSKEPLANVASLVEAEVASSVPTKVSFHGMHADFERWSEKSPPETARWALSTDLGTFVQDAAKDTRFAIALYNAESQKPIQVIPVKVPSFEQRTEFLRRKLTNVSEQMRDLLEIKRECDELALQGARKFAVGGLAGLIVYWGSVYWLTFHKYGWDVMEPITYLTGLSAICGGYIFFLYQQKEISYRSVFELSSKKRREMLYDQKGFNRERWQDLTDEATTLRRAIQQIADDYDVDWKLNDEPGDHKLTEEELDKAEEQEEEATKKQKAKLKNNQR